MSPAGATRRLRVLAVGSDADVCGMLHLHLERAGHAMWCVPSPGDLEPMLRLATPDLVLLMLPAAPDGSWGPALTGAANAARCGTRVLVIAPSRDVVEPLAAVAGAERALSRADVLARPLVVLEAAPAAMPRAASAWSQVASIPVPRPQPTVIRTAPTPPRADFDPPLQPWSRSTPRAPSAADLLAMIDEELIGEPRNVPHQQTRIEVNVSLVSEHNFYVGPTRRVDSGGVFVSSAVPPPIGTRVHVRLGLADGRKIDVEGEVAFVREKTTLGGRQPAGCGIRLHGLPGWAIDAIERFTSARPPIVYVPA
ncbi:MAG TPA: pilus assembly protein PilZ [Anaeromyxobacteraceae bacterium]|nr:pilus assembly protein PilZ [Anaeromyxobacteraceae bacterium]